MSGIEFIAGCFGGAAGVAVGHPLDTLKVKLQTQNPKNPQYSGAIDCMKKTIQAESVRGMYKGMSSPLAGVSVVNAMVFGVHGNIMKKMKDPDALKSHAFAGGSAGLVQSFVTSPMELTKTRMQLQESMGLRGLYKNPLHCLYQICKTEGLRGVFRGQTITILREVPGFTTYFLTYEYFIKNYSIDGEPSTALILGAGGFAGAASWAITYPQDVLKSRLQADGMGGVQKYRGIMHCLKDGLRTEGAGFLTRGISTALVRSFPSNAVTFYVVSSVMTMADKISLEDIQELTVSDILKKSEELVEAYATPIMNYVPGLMKLQYEGM